MKELRQDPIYTEVEETLKRLGIRAILFDLDDTLIYTSEIFIKYMLEYARVVAKTSGLDQARVVKVLEEINDEEYKRMGVNPERWGVVVKKVAEQFPGHEQAILANLYILKKIYTEIPRMREGAKIILEILGRIGVKVALVTHANVEWTNFKLERLGLLDYFEVVTIVDENGHKKKDDWQRAVEAIEVPASNCLFVGDSLGGDIRPGDSLGGRTVWMPSPWAMYRMGEVPENTVKINELADFWDGVSRLK